MVLVSPGTLRQPQHLAGEEEQVLDGLELGLVQVSGDLDVDPGQNDKGGLKLQVRRRKLVQTGDRPNGSVRKDTSQLLCDASCLWELAADDDQSCVGGLEGADRGLYSASIL